MDVRSLWTQLQKQLVHMKVVATVFVAIGITNLVVGILMVVQAVRFFGSDAISQPTGAPPVFGALLMFLLSIPLVFGSLIYLLCAFGIVRRKRVARYVAMVLCFLLAPFSWPVVLAISPRFAQFNCDIIFTFAMYMVWALLRKWGPNDPSHNRTFLQQ
jgi:hypothetical protein